MGTSPSSHTHWVLACPNSPFFFPFTFEYLPGILDLGPPASLPVDADLRLNLIQIFFVYSFSLLILTTSGHLRALLFNCEVKLIVKTSFFNTVHPLWGLIYFKQIWGGVNRDGGIIREGGGGDSFNLAKTVVSVLNRGLEFKVEKLKNK